jgi:hypothetical protein
MCPSWYDEEFLPVLRTLDLNDYQDKANKLARINPWAARKNNELIRAFRAKGYTVHSISGREVSILNKFYETADTLFSENYLVDNASYELFVSHTQLLLLNELLHETLAPWALIFPFIGEPANRIFFAKAINGEVVPQRIADKTALFGNKYDGTDQWYVDALIEIFAGAEPQLTIIHDLKTHGPFIRNEDGSSQARSEAATVDSAHYPPQHRYTAKIVLAYIALILEHDPDAIIVVQADHGLHGEESREALLERGGSEEDVRVMQNQVMSAVRIPEKWGGMQEPLDPLDISRVLINQYVGQNDPLVTTPP